IGKRLPRVTVPDFDYNARAAERFEVPLADRIAEIRKRKAEERARAKANAERRAANVGGHAPRGGGPSHARPSSGGRPGGSGQPGGGGQRAHSRPGGQPGG